MRRRLLGLRWGARELRQLQNGPVRQDHWQPHHGFNPNAHRLRVTGPRLGNMLRPSLPHNLKRAAATSNICQPSKLKPRLRVHQEARPAQASQRSGRLQQPTAPAARSSKRASSPQRQPRQQPSAPTAPAVRSASSPAKAGPPATAPAQAAKEAPSCQPARARTTAAAARSTGPGQKHLDPFSSSGARTSNHQIPRLRSHQRSPPKRDSGLCRITAHERWIARPKS